MSEPGRLSLQTLELPTPGDDDVVVDIEWSGISTGTERLLWEGTMQAFPGMGYPLVPGYESVGVVSARGADVGIPTGTRVFVSGARCYGEIRGLFGGASSRVVVPASKVISLPDAVREQGVMLALAATACHALRLPGQRPPGLIVGHGVLGRLLARLSLAFGHPPPVVWEIDPRRRAGDHGYEVVDPSEDSERRYTSIIDASGAGQLLDTLIARLEHGGEVILAGFYHERLGFDFAPAFMREASIRTAAEWQPDDLQTVRDLLDQGGLQVDDLLTHRVPADQAATAYTTAFSDPDCLKMILDWRTTP
jgi:3-hydroxyethyl bacteriochlorophyllide a dehydrogenase